MIRRLKRWWFGPVPIITWTPPESSQQTCQWGQDADGTIVYRPTQTFGWRAIGGGVVDLAWLEGMEGYLVKEYLWDKVPEGL